MSQDVMYPTTSDLLPENYDADLKRIRFILSENNSAVLVSKPHLEVWQKYAADLAEYQDRLIIRFTIGSFNNELLKLLEPKAPLFEERLECLKLMYQQGYKTSVSIECWGRLERTDYGGTEYGASGSFMSFHRSTSPLL